MRAHPLILLLVLASVSALHAFEPGFYSGTDASQRAQIDEIIRLEQKADRTLSCGGDLKYDLGLGSVRGRMRHPIEFAREDIEPFLKNERHKDLLVVRCEKTIMWSDDKLLLIAEVENFVTKLGYKRVLILGDHAFGMHVLKDIDHKDAEPVAPANRSPATGGGS